MVLSSWQGHCKSLPDSFDECRLSARWPPTLKPSQTTWLVSPLVGCYHPHPPSPLLVLLSPIADTHFTIPRRVKGWVDLGTAVRVCSLCPWLYIAVAVMINTTACDLSHHSEASTRLTTCRSKWVWTTCLMVFMAALCNRGAIIFLPCDFYLSFFFFFPRLISAATDWISTILLHMAWP